MQELTFDTARPYNPPQKKQAKKILLLAFAILFILIVLGVILFGKGRGKDVEDAATTPTPTLAFLPTDTPEPTPTEVPTDTPSPKVTVKPTVSPTEVKASPTGQAAAERSKLSLTVLNGSGIPGAAKGVADYLQGLGYTVTGTGNADNYDYTDVSFNLKTGNSDLSSTLKKDLSAKYTVGTTSATLTSGDAGGVVIVGK